MKGNKVDTPKLGRPSIMSSVHQFPMRIYYEDTDVSGNVYHAAYLKFLERARTELLRERGVSHTILGKSGLAFVVRRMDISYDCPAHLDDELLIETEFVEIAGARLEMKQTALCDGKVLMWALVTIVLVNGKGRPCRLPAELAEKLG